MVDVGEARWGEVGRVLVGRDVVVGRETRWNLRGYLYPRHRPVYQKYHTRRSRNGDRITERVPIIPRGVSEDGDGLAGMGQRHHSPRSLRSPLLPHNGE